MNSGSLIEVFVRNTNRGVAASYTSLRDGETVERTLTHVELLQRARALAGWMKQKGFSGKRAIMVFPVGLEFVEAFLACLMANVIAVPVAPVPLTGDSNKVRRMLAIMEDCQPSLVLGVSKSIGNSALFVGRYPQYGNLTWLEVDRFDEWDSLSDLSFDMPSPEAIALLQYTSGSTGMPKGVMLSHRNILSNLQQWDQGLGHDDDSKLVCWVPHYHDLGLRAAREQVNAVSSTSLPRLDADAGIGYSRTSPNTPFGLALGQQSIKGSQYSIETRASWEPDLWGRVANAVKTANTRVELAKIHHDEATADWLPPPPPRMAPGAPATT